MTPVLEILGWTCLLLAAGGAVYGALAAWALGRFMRRPVQSLGGLPSITVLKPLHGDEPGLHENIASFCAQDYPGAVQLILGVQNPADPALVIAEQIRRDHPDRDIVVVCDATPHGTNRKIGNLINMSARATGEIIVISDSDVRLPTCGLTRIAAALEQPGVGLIHCLYRGRPTASFWSKIAAMDINTRFAASVVVGEALGAHPCLGPTMALPARVLAQIGGLKRIADFLADDFELGRAVREAGYRIGWPPMLIDHVFPENAFREAFVHELRWARTIWRVQPAGYLGSVVMHVAPLALIGGALAAFSGAGGALALGLVIFRLLQADQLNRMMGGDRRLIGLVIPRDLMSFAVFLTALTGDRVEWRGSSLRASRDGTMSAP